MSSVLMAAGVIAAAASSSGLPAARAADHGPRLAASHDGVTARALPRRFAAADRSTGAMFRWWWPNAAVEKAVLVDQLDAVAEAGYKGVEIAAVFGLASVFPGSISYPVDPDIYGYGTRRWNDAVEAVLVAARKRGLQVDLTLGAHWPPSVPGLDVDGPGTTKELTYGYAVVGAGESVDGPLPQPTPRTYTDRTSQNGVVTTTTRTAKPRLVGVAALRCSADCDGRPQVDLDSTVDLTARAKDGALRWAASDDGTWVVVSYWYRGTGIRNDLPLGPLASLYTDPEARAIDYFSRDGAEAFATYFNGLLPQRTRELMRAVGGSLFDESIEIGAGAAQLWTPRLLSEFEARRGYSLRPYLALLAAEPRSGFGGLPSPAFAFDAADAAVGKRVLRDVDQTLSDLYMDEHVRPFTRWATKLGLDYRAQPYGQPVDMAQAAGIVDVPECENFACGVSDDWRLMTSGADLAGAAIVSGEMIPGIGNGPGTSPYTIWQAQVLREVNEQWALGANQMVFHGLPYPHWPPAADGSRTDSHGGWPGFQPFATVFPEAFGPRMPAWRMASDSSGYFARTQLVLQAGERRTDVAFYNQSLGHVSTPAAASGLVERGYSYGYVTPGALMLPGATVRDRRLGPDGPRFAALIVADQATMPLATARRIARLAADGLPVIFAGARPMAVPGYAATAAAAKARDAELRAVIAALVARPNVRTVRAVASLPAALSAIGVAPAVSSSGPLDVVRRVDGPVTYHYVRNPAAEAVTRRIALSEAGGRVPYLLHAWTGAVEPIAEYARRGATVQIDLDLAAGGAAIVALAPPSWITGGGGSLHATATTADAVVRAGGRLVARASTPGTYETKLSDGRRVTTRVRSLPAVAVPRRWDLVVSDWRPATPGQASSDMNYTRLSLPGFELAPWSSVPELADAAGIGTYATTVQVPRAIGDADGWRLDLGRVSGPFRVRVNGRSVGVADQLSSVVDLGSRLRPGANRIEVTYATTLINRVRLAQQPFMTLPKQHYGLLGPVTLAPYADMELTGDLRR